MQHQDHHDQGFEIINNNPSQNTFPELGLPDKLSSVYKDLNFITPTPIQHATISHGISGKDLIAQSKAGTGKTLAFLSVVLTQLNPQNDTLQGLILVPTRELALQVHEVASKITKKIKEKPQIKLGLMIGGIPIEDDRNALRLKVHLVIGTLGRVHGLIKEKSMKINDVKILVLDEADKILTTHGMRDQLNYIYTRLENNAERAQVLNFSATYSEESFRLVKGIGYNHKIIKVIGDVEDKQGGEEGEVNKIDLNVSTLKQYYKKIVRREDDRVGVNTLKNRIVVDLLKNVKYEQAIIFYNDKGLGEELESDLREEGISLHFIHGDQTQAERMRIMNKLKLKRVNILLATDLVSKKI